ncbi:hypothetical protein FMEXI_3441 [Fusarium mexicanum]|uniref:Uncharacterized protein n=1 Tax=Fusarium mexicanum TaxID=751941 RepID=A0A8H5J9I2_9HYPO|nr:hypothetical protein FMEXI_3441 [Fusarium mexicanum]
MTSITNTKGYTVAFKFYEIDTIEKNQKAAGNNLFEPIRQKYGDRLVECDVDNWRLFIVITQCLDADGQQLYQELLKVFEKAGLFHQGDRFKEPQLFEWTVLEKTTERLTESSKHRSDTLELFHSVHRAQVYKRADAARVFHPDCTQQYSNQVTAKYITDKMNRMGHHVYDRDMVIIFWFHARRPMNSTQRRLARRDRVFASLREYYGSTLLPIVWRGSELYITIRDCVAVRATLPELMSVLERIRLFQFFELCGIIAFDHNDGELTENLRYDRDGVALLFRLDRELRMYRELNPFNYLLSD